MRQGPMSLLLCLLLLSPFATAEQPLSLEAGARITDLQQRLEESEKQRDALTQQLQRQDSERESAQLTRLRQDNQRLKLAVKERRPAPAPPAVADRAAAMVPGRRGRCTVVGRLRYLSQRRTQKTPSMVELSET